MAAPGTTINQQDGDSGSWLVFQVVHDGNHDAADADAADDNSNSNSNKNTTFTPFLALPTELRLEIWEYLIQPRIVLVLSVTSRSQNRRRLRRSKTPAIPALLHVNRESRALALRHYELAFSWETPWWGRARSPAPPASKDARVWFNFGLDTLFLLGGMDVYTPRCLTEPLFRCLDHKDVRRVRHVACSFRALRRTIFPQDTLYREILLTFTSAQQLLITITPREVARPGRAWPSAYLLQYLWMEFVKGSTCLTARLYGKQILMIQEDELSGYITAHC